MPQRILGKQSEIQIDGKADDECGDGAPVDGFRGGNLMAVTTAANEEVVRDHDPRNERHRIGQIAEIAQEALQQALREAVIGERRRQHAGRQIDVETRHVERVAAGEASGVEVVHLVREALHENRDGGERADADGRESLAHIAGADGETEDDAEQVEAEIADQEFGDGCCVDRAGVAGEPRDIRRDRRALHPLGCAERDHCHDAQLVGLRGMAVDDLAPASGMVDRRDHGDQHRDDHQRNADPSDPGQAFGETDGGQHRVDDAERDYIEQPISLTARKHVSGDGGAVADKAD